jgi:hypothetical protein
VSERVKVQKRFKVNVVIYLGVNALLAAAWLAVTVAGVSMSNSGISLAIYVGLMVLWGARVVLDGLRAYRGLANR